MGMAIVAPRLARNSFSHPGMLRNAKISVATYRNTSRTTAAMATAALFLFFINHFLSGRCCVSPVCVNYTPQNNVNARKRIRILKIRHVCFTTAMISYGYLHGMRKRSGYSSHPHHALAAWGRSQRQNACFWAFCVHHRCNSHCIIVNWCEI